MAYEDYTTYTKVDPNSRFSVSANQITVTDITKNEDAYISKDFGENYFDDTTEINFDGEITSSELYSSVFILRLANYVGKDPPASPENRIRTQLAKISGGSNVIRLYVNDDGGDVNNDYSAISVNTRYYMNFKRTSTSITVKIYTDNNHTNLYDTISVSDLTAGVKYQYLDVVHSNNSGSTYKISVKTYNHEILSPSGTTPSSSQKFIPEYSTGTFIKT